MAVTLQTRSPGPRARAPATRGGAAAPSGKLLHDALHDIDLARSCAERGRDARRHLHAAILSLRALPAALTVRADSARAAVLTDLTEYVCRQLATTDDPATLAAMCDLVREIRCAWVRPPAAASTLCGAGAVPALM